MLYSLKNITCCYAESGGVKALDGIDLEVDSAEFIALIGAIGAGKSTLLKLLIGLLKPVSGEVLYKGKALPGSGAGLRNLRQEVGISFQFAENQIFEATVRREAAFGLRNFEFPPDEIPRLTEEALALFGLNPQIFGERSPFDLSAGERKRLALASIFALKPQFLLLDEPAAGLDSQGVKILKSALSEHRSFGGGALIVTHDLDFAAAICPRVVILSQGRKLYDGDRSVYYNSEILSAAALDAPEIVQAWQEIQLQNSSLRKNIFTLEEAYLSLDYADGAN